MTFEIFNVRFCTVDTLDLVVNRSIFCLLRNLVTIYDNQIKNMHFELNCPHLCESLASGKLLPENHIRSEYFTTNFIILPTLDMLINSMISACDISNVLMKLNMV